MPLVWEKTFRLSSLPMSCRSAATERSVTGMISLPSRNCVVSSPLRVDCSDRATSWLVTPARRARGWLISTSSFLVLRPQSSVMLRVPGIERSSALTCSTREKATSASRPETRTWIGLTTGGPYSEGRIVATRSGKRSPQKASQTAHRLRDELRRGRVDQQERVGRVRLLHVGVEDVARLAAADEGGPVGHALRPLRTGRQLRGQETLDLPRHRVGGLDCGAGGQPELGREEVAVGAGEEQLGHPAEAGHGGDEEGDHRPDGEPAAFQ